MHGDGRTVEGKGGVREGVLTCRFAGNTESSRKKLGRLNKGTLPDPSPKPAERKRIYAKRSAATLWVWGEIFVRIASHRFFCVELTRSAGDQAPSPPDFALALSAFLGILPPTGIRFLSEDVR